MDSGWSNDQEQSPEQFASARKAEDALEMRWKGVERRVNRLTPGGVIGLDASIAAVVPTTPWGRCPVKDGHRLPWHLFGRLSPYTRSWQSMSRS